MSDCTPSRMPDHRVATEEDARAWLRELREHEPRGERQRHQAEERLERDDDVRERRLGHHAAVPDRRHRLDAEEVRVSEAPGPGVLDAAVEVIDRREDGVRAQVADEDDREENPPGGRQKEMVEVRQRAPGDPDLDHRVLVRAAAESAGPSMLRHSPEKDRPRTPAAVRPHAACRRATHRRRR